MRNNMVQICPLCENGVEITEIKSYPDYRRRFFSCGHIHKPNEKGFGEHTDGMTNLSRQTPRVAASETINISPVAAIVLSRLKQSKEVKVKEKTISGKAWLQFYTTSIRFGINNEEISIHLLETKFSEKIVPKDILGRVSTLTGEIRTDSTIRDKERKKILGLLERLNNILASQTKRIIVGGKWTFSLASPYILKTIEILSDSSTDNYNSNTNGNSNTKETPA
jgi:hypothetical protein